MGAVLWENHMSEGRVTCGEYDLPALYRHAQRLDAICAKLGISAFSDLIDHTDAEVNMDVIELPDTMESTSDLMVRSGVWADTDVMLDVLQALLAHLETEKPRIGLIRDDRPAVIEELQHAISFATTHRAAGSKLNFCVVM